MVAALAALQAAMPQAAGATSDLYTHLTLIDPEKETRIANSTSLWKTGRSPKWVSKNRRVSPTPDRVQDMTGRYALAGFIDAHAHITLGSETVEVHNGVPSVTFKSSDAVSERYGKAALAYGVTTIRSHLAREQSPAVQPPPDRQKVGINAVPPGDLGD
jgi:hypothetical protein